MHTNTAHRPWELPGQPWAMAMQWHDLLFMHWPLPVAALREHIPPTLTIDTFDGMAWIGVVPFHMRGVRPRYLPALPGLATFAELNLRSYVIAGDKPGVWFFSLDAANPLAVRGARWMFHLPYYDAWMLTERTNAWVSYASQRTHRSAPPAAFQARYQPVGPVYRSAPGSIDHWLTERYCLYAADRHGRAWRGEIHHPPWPLQPAAADVVVNSMTQQINLDLPDVPPLLHFTRRLDVVAWTLQPV